MEYVLKGNHMEYVLRVNYFNYLKFNKAHFSVGQK